MMVDDMNKVLHDAIREQMKRALDEHRTEPERGLFATEPFYRRVPPPTRRQRVLRAVRRYGAGWRDALGALRRACLGRDVFPDCECD